MNEKTQPSRRVPSSVAAEQVERRIAAGEPLSMTQDEVEAMAKGGDSTRKVAQRLTNHGATVAVRSQKSSPVAITSDELEKINASAELPAKIRQRLEESTRLPQESLARPVVTEKTAPTAAPPEQ